MSLLSSIGRGIAGAVGGLFTGGPAGAVLGGVAGAFGGGSKPPAAPMPATGGFTFSGPFGTGVTAYPGGFGVTGFGAGVTFGKPPGTAMVGSGGAVTKGTSCGSCPGGYHVNRHTLNATRGGCGRAPLPVRPPGTWCVRNRRMNPLNGHAAMRSIRRLKSARKAMRHINAFVGPKRSSCGCKGKKR